MQKTQARAVKRNKKRASQQPELVEFDKPRLVSSLSPKQGGKVSTVKREVIDIPTPIMKTAQGQSRRKLGTGINGHLLTQASRLIEKAKKKSVEVSKKAEPLKTDRQYKTESNPFSLHCLNHAPSSTKPSLSYFTSARGNESKMTFAHTKAMSSCSMIGQEGYTSIKQNENKASAIHFVDNLLNAKNIQSSIRMHPLPTTRASEIRESSNFSYEMSGKKTANPPQNKKVRQSGSARKQAEGTIKKEYDLIGGTKIQSLKDRLKTLTAISPKSIDPSNNSAVIDIPAEVQRSFFTKQASPQPLSLPKQNNLVSNSPPELSPVIIQLNELKVRLKKILNNAPRRIESLQQQLLSMKHQTKDY